MRATWFSTACICVSLIGITIVAYFPVLFCDFVTYDDPGYVYQNPNVLNGVTAAGWKYAWTSYDCGNWHPLTWLSLELDGSLWKKTPAGYHATNLALHLSNVVLLFVVLHRMTNNLLCNFVVAALFAVHPLHVESVAWISERKDVLSTLFLLLTLLAYVSYANCPSVLRYILVVVLFATGLLAKPMLVTLPILLLLFDIWPLNRIQWSGIDSEKAASPRRPLKRILVEKLPLLCLAFGDGLITMNAQKVATNYLRELPFDARAANALDSYLWYLQKTFVPTNLIVFYPHLERRLDWDSVALAAFAFVGITLFVLLTRKTKPHLLVGWAWFVISLLPVIGLLQVGGQSHADRYAYIPHIGLFLAIIWELHSLLLRNWSSNFEGPIPDHQGAVAPANRMWRLSKMMLGPFVFCGLALAVTVSCGMLTRSQLAFWKNGDTLWTHVLEVMPDNFGAHAHLADIRFEEGKFEQALEHIERGNHVERGLRLNSPAYVANAYYNWGRCLMALDRLAEGEEKLREALKVDPLHEGTLNEISRLLEKQGRHAEAAEHAEVVAKWARKNPENPAALLSLGLAEARRGNLEAAIMHFKKAVHISPRSAEALSNLGLALAQSNRLAEAKSSFLRVLELNPNVGVAHFSLALIYEEEHDLPNARKHFAEAYRLDPKDVEAKTNLERVSSQ